MRYMPLDYIKSKRFFWDDSSQEEIKKHFHGPPREESFGGGLLSHLFTADKIAANTVTTARIR